MTALPANSLFADRPVKRGRGATPRRERFVTLDRPNPAGRRKLDFRYRPLKRWQSWYIEIVKSRADEVTKHPSSATPSLRHFATPSLLHTIAVVPESRLDLAERAITYYFKRIGGFRLADDAIVRLVYESLERYMDEAARLGITPARLLRWAIDAKAKSLESTDPDERRHKRSFVPHPESFFTAKALDYWLDRSEQWTEHLAKLRHAAQERQLAHRIDEEATKRRSDGATEQQQSPDPLAFFGQLSPQQQRRAINHVKPDWLQQCANYGEDPDSPSMQDLLKRKAASWAIYIWSPQEATKRRSDEATKGDRV